MRFLADENFPRLVVDSLRDDGHDVVWARSDFPGLKDSELLDRAEAESRLVLTLDTDFWQIALQRRKPLEQAGVILFRIHPAIAGKLGPLVSLALKSGRSWVKHVSVVTPESIQMVPARQSRPGR